MNQQNQKRAKNLAGTLFIASIAVSIAGAIVSAKMGYMGLGKPICINDIGSDIAYFTLLGSQMAAVILGISSQIYDLIRRQIKIKSLFKFIMNMMVICLAIVFTTNFDRGHFHCQSEAKQNLAAIWTAYTSYYSDYGTFPRAPYIVKNGKTYNCLSIADWEPKKNFRYSYKCMGTVVYSPRRGGVDCEEAITGASQNDFTVAACANIDRDSTVDEWTIDTAKKLKNIVDDVKN